MAEVDFLTKAKEQVRVESIGLGGLCFVTETDISGESILGLSLESDTEQSPSLNINISAKIVWHIFDEATRLHTAGTQFIEMDESATRTLREFLDSLEVQTEREKPAGGQDGADA
jgi:c-di-GMP-binding flagellar brake protein YcgR